MCLRWRIRTFPCRSEIASVKGTFDVPEQFAFDQVFGDGPGINRDERFLLPVDYSGE